MLFVKNSAISTSVGDLFELVAVLLLYKKCKKNNYGMWTIDQSIVNPSFVFSKLEKNYSKYYNMKAHPGPDTGENQTQK